MTSGWNGVTLGISVGVGVSFNRGTVYMGKSNSTLLNNVQKTSDRSWLDKWSNKYFTTVSALAQYLSR